MKQEIPITCPHHPKCQIGHKATVIMPDICGVSGCDKVAQCIIQEGNVFYKVCLIHGQGKEVKVLSNHLKDLEIKE